MRTVVAKFGGTSLADADMIRQTGKIIMSDPDRKYIVVSAPGKRFPEDSKVTDLLLHCYRSAVEGMDYEPELLTVQNRFLEMARELELDLPITQEFEPLRASLEEISGAEEDKKQDLYWLETRKAYIVSRGEYLNARILASYLDYTFVDPEWCVCFEENGKLNLPMTLRTMGASLRPLKNAVIAGFYGADMEGAVHTFSRGGSDVTGSLAAAAVHADLYENWTDVSGLLAADPRIVESPKSVRYVSYRELRTLSYMGASVLHTDAVLPVSDLDIPINIRNTDRPQDDGTMIVRKLPSGETKYPIIAVAGRVGMSVIQVEKVMVSDESGFTAVMLDILKKRQLPFEQCLTGIDTITLVIRSDLLEPCKEDLFEEIRSTLDPDFLGLTENLAMIAVIGEKGTESSDANVRVLKSLTEAGILISTINQGAGKLNLLIGVQEEKYEEAVRTIYAAIEQQAL